jgi:hypothetical protein
MSYNGSGTFNINSAGQPVVAGTVISATAFNALTADLGVGLSTAITKDGQTTTTARITFAQGVTSSLTTDSSSTSTGSIITAGGVGIAKALFVGTTLNVTGASTLAAITGTFNGTVGATTPAAGSFTSITNTGLTSGRVPYTTTAGLLTDSTNLTFNGTTLSINGGGAADLNIPAASIENQKFLVFRRASGNFGMGLYTDSSDNSTMLAWGSLAFATGSSVTERMRIDSSGNLLVGTTTAGAGLGFATRLAVEGGEASVFKTNAGASGYCSRMWNSATSGDNLFVNFQTEAGGTDRGSITYNRGAGLVAYNVTSDYRAKDISGPVTDSGTLIDSVPVYMGTMKGATQERPMFIAHETPEYAHTGEKDAVDEDGNPVYQQMDASALIPVMWAEIQSLRKRLAALEAK